MKVAVIQPPYSVKLEDAENRIQWELDALDKCDESLDIIVMPEYSDVPVRVYTSEEFFAISNKYNELIVNKARETAKRCHSMLFISAVSWTATGPRNTTYAFNRDGEEVGHYYKQHPVMSEIFERGMDGSYSFEYTEPYILEMEGYRFAFLTCYDFYFYEYFSQIARRNVDFIIGCSHQRSDRHSALEIFGRFLCYNTNAYLLRSSVSMGEDSEVGGCSMVVAPDGEMLANMFSTTGMAVVEIDPDKKYYKPAGYGSAPSAHYEYVEIGRRPWKYRPGGSMIVNYDQYMEYPRVCAHRGYHINAPENSIPAFAEAISLGAEEIEFDLWFTKDEEIVSSHDIELERVSDGKGWIIHKTYEELAALDFGSKANAKGYEGLKIAKFEDILRKFAGHAVMNIHIKDTDFPRERAEKVVALIRQYDCARHCYILPSNDACSAILHEVAPEIPQVQGAGKDPWNIVENAIRNKCQKVQLFKPYFNQEMVDKAHSLGLKCNVFYADDPEEAKRYLDMGIDTILTNNYYPVSKAVKEWKAEHSAKKQ